MKIAEIKETLKAELLVGEDNWIKTSSLPAERI